MSRAAAASGTQTSADWHALSAAEVLLRLGTDPEQGLADSEYRARLERYGPNALTTKKGRPAWLRFLLQFNQPLIYILLAASLITLFLHEWVDSAVIFTVVLVNSFIGFIQESKALKALDALSRTMTARAAVLRGGCRVQADSSELVPGDVVLLASGDRVPADARIVSCRELRVNESALTGESVPVEKISEPVAAAAGLADRINLVFASTLVTYGQAKAVIVSTGDATEVGRISELISSAEDLATPLTRKIAEFSRFLLYVILVMAAVMFAVGVLVRGQSAIDMFMAAVALAVSAIPEGLPAAVTITLAIGVSRMARRRAIIRKLPAVETLGSTSIICSDKTGTLTENQMTVQTAAAGGRVYELTGAGYAPEGAVLGADAKPVCPLPPELEECLRAGLLCNDSRLVKSENGRAEVEGDPTEGALIVSALKAGLRVETETASQKRIDTLPFESEHQYMAVLCHAGTDGGPDHGSADARVVYLKGSIEKVLERCADQMAAGGGRTAFSAGAAHEEAARMAARGLRVLAFARAEKPTGQTAVGHEDVRSGMTFLGLQAMIDPPRAEAVLAVQHCRRAGIAVKMITGDHALTASAIAARLGLEETADGTLPDVVTGKQMEGFTDARFMETARRVNVFARVTPEQKLRLVRALQSDGSVVAMTGDGVNDAPALKQANIGVAMGRSGTEVAKEAADMVLTDDNFASIEAAVEEGRCVFDNLRKFIIWTLPTNLGEALAIMLAVFAGVALPIVPVQILWINMTTAVCLGMMLAFEPKEPDVMGRPPRHPSTPILTRDVLIRTLYVGCLLVAGVFGLFIWEKHCGASLEQARTVATAMLVIGETFYLFSCRSLTRSPFSIGFFANRWLLWGVMIMIGLQLIFTYSPVMNRFFHSAPIGPDSWLRVIAAGAAVYAVVGAEKTVRLFLGRRRDGRSSRCGRDKVRTA